MLATPWPAPFADPGWVFEVKWDGVRTLVHATPEEVALRSRAGNDVTARYPEIRPRVEIPVVLDGEIVALDDTGRPSFERLQRRMNLASSSMVAEAMQTTPVGFVVFDLLYHDGDVTALPLEQRRDLLLGLELPAPVVVSEQFTGDPAPLWELVRQRQMEGIVGKRLGSPYRPGTRSPDWRKIAVVRSLRAVVGGFTPGTGGRSETFGSLLLGLFDQGGLRWIGSVGTGFDDAGLRAIRRALDEMVIPSSPFLGGDVPRDATWVEPRLVAAVGYKEWTAAGRLRAPVFKGFTGHPPESVTWEAEGPASS